MSAVRRPLGALLAVLALLLVVGGSLGGGAAAAEPTDPPTAPPAAPSTEPELTPEPTPGPEPGPEPEPTDPVDGPAVVRDAVLRWGVSDESNNAAHEPGSHNFFSAGAVVPPLGLHLRESQWRAADGDVAVEKWDGSRWRPATWTGLRTTSGGVPITDPSAGTFSNHQVVLSGGTGELDRTAGTASIAWRGSFTVVYYAGRSFFQVADPALEVRGGRGTLTGTVSGYASSREDPTVREPVAPRRVVLADLGAVDLAAGSGFTARPAYDGVRVQGTSQRTDVPHAGSFPQSFVDYMERLGTGAFWYSSGSATDPFKRALPVTVSYDASTPVVVPVPPTAPTTPVETPVNEVRQPPARPVAPSTGRAPTAALAPVRPDALGVPLAARAATSGPLPVAHDLVAVAATSAGAPPPDATSPLWWVGGALLLLAAGALAAPGGRPTLPRRSGGIPTR